MNWTYNTLWSDKLPPKEYHNFECKNTKASLTTPVAGSYFRIRNFKPKDRCFENYPAITTATYLELGLSNVTSFKGISKMGTIKRLELHRCIKLESDEGLSEIRDDLEWLHINQSKKFSPSTELLSLKNLKVLCLNSCAPLENLQFLSEFPQLVDFRFVDTNVLDGDLSPLFDHPTLLSVGFLNKKHYNRTEKQTDEYFGERVESKQEWVHDGQFATHRYKIFSHINSLK